MTDYEIVDVTKLQKAEGVKDGDTLLLIRQQGDGTSICMRTDGAQFKGTDAYDVAKANGFSGTREEWAQQVAVVQKGSGKVYIKSTTANIRTAGESSATQQRVSNSQGQISLFVFDGTDWNCSYFNGRMYSS